MRVSRPVLRGAEGETPSVYSPIAVLAIFSVVLLRKARIFLRKRMRTQWASMPITLVPVHSGQDLTNLFMFCDLFAP